MNLIKNNKIYPKSYFLELQDKEYKKILIDMKDYILKNNYDIVNDKEKIIILYYLHNHLF